jgi:hypothetical protein
MKYQLLTAASVLAFGLVVGAAVLPSYTTPVKVKAALVERVDRTNKTDRLPLATFAERWDAVADMEAKKFPALAAWLKVKGAAAPVVAAGH